MKKNRVFITFLLIVVLVFSEVLPVFNSGSVKADETNAFSCSCLLGSNEGTNDYIDTDPMIYSYLVPVESGFMRVQGNAGNTGISVSYYDFDYNIIERREIPAELPLFGGFKDTASAFFIVSAQTNPNESDSVEVFRITKYDRNWNRVASCSLYGANTVEPFRAGSCKTVQ